MSGQGCLDEVLEWRNICVSQWLRSHTGVETPTFVFKSYHANPVPEPATIIVWGLIGVGGLAYGVRKRRVHHASR